MSTEGLDFEKIFEYVSFPISVGSPEPPNLLLYVNQAYCDMTGYSKEELIGTNPGKLLQGTTADKTREMIREKLNAKEQIDVLVKNYRKDGSIFYNELHIHPVIDEEGQCLYFVGTPKDVTDRIRCAEETMHKLVHKVKAGFRELRHTLNEV